MTRGLRSTARRARSTSSSRPKTSTARSRRRDVLLQPPAPRRAAQAACWQGLANGTLQVSPPTTRPTASTNQASSRKATPTFKDMANGVPGIELRIPLLFSYGFGAGRMTLNEFVALSATRHAQLMGSIPAKEPSLSAGMRIRDLGSGQPRPRHRRDGPRPGRLHAVRGARAHGMAGHGDLARARRRSGRSARCRARHRAVRARRPLRLGAPTRRAGARAGRLRTLGLALELRPRGGRSAGLSSREEREVWNYGVEKRGERSAPSTDATARRGPRSPGRALRGGRGHAAASVWSELAPDRFSRLFPDRRPPDSR